MIASLLPTLLSVAISAVQIAPAQEPTDTIRLEFPDTLSAPLHRMSEPVLVVGQLEGPEAYLLDGVTEINLLDNGGVRIATSRGTEIREFDAAGSYVRTFGRPGQGPGEFGRIQATASFPDSLIVAADGRITVFDGKGVVRSTHALPPMEVVGFTGRRGAFGYSGARVNVLEVATGAHAVSGSVVISDWGAGAVDTLGTTPMQGAWVEERNGGRSVSSIPFTPTSKLAASGSMVVFGWAGEPRLAVLEQGRLRLVTWSRPPLPVTDRDLEAHVMSWDPTDRPARRRQLADMPLPDTKPYFTEVVLSDSGQIWVADGASDRDEATLWLILDLAARRSGYVRTPPNFRVLVVERGRVAGVQRGEFDVQRVLVYSLDPG